MTSDHRISVYVPGGVLNDDLTTDELGIIIVDAHDHSLIGFVPLPSTSASGDRGVALTSAAAREITPAK